MKPGQLRHHLMAVPYWIGHTIHNFWGIINVFDIAWLRPIPGGLLDESHPFVGGPTADSHRDHWIRNIVFRSERDRDHPDSDEEIVCKTMNHLRLMVRSSSATTEHDKGRPTRMPPAINYIHGCVHYNGVSLLFNDFQDGIRHFTDPRFKRELHRMIDAEGREPTIVFRNREYDSDEFALFSCFMKSIFPYFGNPNGNRRRKHWGTPAPYPAFNLITGNWIRDTRSLLTEEGRRTVGRPPADASRYFQEGGYGTGWSEYLLPERIFCAFTQWRINIRGEKEGIYFVDARKLKVGYRFDPENLPTLRGRIIERIRDRKERLLDQRVPGLRRKAGKTGRELIG